MEQFGGSPPSDGIIGWIETDGVPGFSEDDEPVSIGDHIENDVTVYSLCYNCTCEDEIQCQQHICTPCEEGEEEIYVEGECCPRCQPKSDKCSLRSETKKIEFTDEEGQLCVTPDEITITYCAGACDSYDSSTIYSIDGETIVHDHECKCCTGEGELVSQSVKCGSRTREIKIKMFHTCGCNRCEGEGLSEKKSTDKRSKYSKRSSSHSPTLPPEYQTSDTLSSKQQINKNDAITYDSKLLKNVDFNPPQAKDALYKSGSSYPLRSDSTFLLMKLNVDRDVDSISFNTAGSGKIRVDILDEDDEFILQKMISQSGTHTYELNGRPMDLMITLVDGSEVDVSKLILNYEPQYSNKM